MIEALIYTYDAAGNRTSQIRTNGTASTLPAAVQAAYDVANEQEKFSSPLPATPNLDYDADGNLFREKDNAGTVVRQYAWDARNRLIEISGNATASFKYDTLGRRVSKTINGITTQYLYDGKNIAEEIGSGAVGVSYLRSLKVDEFFVRQSSDAEYYHADVLGSALTLTGQAGAVQTTYFYEAFGKTTVTGSSTNPFQYSGRESDGTSLYYYRARYYSPQLDRFLSEDPILAPFTPLAVGMCQASNFTVWLLPSRIGLPLPDTAQFLNPYAYVNNNPVKRRDPSGLIQQAPCKNETDTCINVTKGSKIGECTGTAYGLYLGGDTGACKNRKYPNKQCMTEDYYTVSKRCQEYGEPYEQSLPTECTVNVFNCIQNMK